MLMISVLGLLSGRQSAFVSNLSELVIEEGEKKSKQTSDSDDNFNSLSDDRYVSKWHANPSGDILKKPV